MEPQFQVLPPERPRVQPPRPGGKGIWGGLAVAGALMVKFLGPLLIFLKTGFSMLISIGAYSLLYGWKFATGIVLLIFVHEMGHFIAAKAYRIPVSAPMFIPFLGAYVLLSKNHLLGSWTNAIISYAGPLAGGLGGWACFYLALSLDSSWMMAVAFYTFLLNLINLLPVPPMDGSHIWTAFARRFTPDMTLSDRFYIGIFLAGLLAGLVLGLLQAHPYLEPIR